MKKQFIFLTLLILTLIIVPRLQSFADSNPISSLFVYAQSDNSTQTNQTVTVAQHEFTFDRQFYLPTKITLNYPYTNEHDIRNVTTVGMSQYKYDITPIGVNFIVEQVDLYSFTVELRYDNASRRDILVGIWEGDRPLEGYLWSETGTEYVLHFRVSTTNQPAYPTGDEIANLTFLKFEELYVQQLEENRRELSELTQSQFINTVLMLVAAAVSVIALLLAGFGYKQRKMKGQLE